MSPRAIVERALELRLDMIAVTDHNSVENALHASALGERLGLRVVCGMEAQTREDVHLLCLFPNPRAAEAFYGRVYPLLPEVANNPDFFGDQVVVDCEDNIVRTEPRLLLNSPGPQPRRVGRAGARAGRPSSSPRTWRARASAS
ncbi:MAG: PHP domain-containing protein [Comamonadaceae bacterium]|nr:PHP domain-containing protein [Comamonadaceae bacterium]